MTATHDQNSTLPTAPVLYFSLELGWNTWKLAFTVGAGQKPRVRTIRARNLEALLAEIQAAKARFGLPEDAKVVSCYEAGRDGFWLHRFLLAQGVENIVVDSASIEVNRRKRRAKSDRLDAVKLVAMLMRWCNGENKVWAVVHPPSAEDEDHRQLHRELIALKAERTGHSNAIKGMLAGLGLQCSRQMCISPSGWRSCGSGMTRASRRLASADPPRIRAVADGQPPDSRPGAGAGQEDPRRPDPACRTGAPAAGASRGSGRTERGCWWRSFSPGVRSRTVASWGAWRDLAPTPYASGESRREQGISKAGNRRVRWMMVQLAWGWLRYQPRERLEPVVSLERFGPGNARQRKIGIVALARKLLIALWKYLETGEPPEGAEVIGWDKKHESRGWPRSRHRESREPSVMSRGQRGIGLWAESSGSLRLLGWGIVPALGGERVEFLPVKPALRSGHPTTGSTVGPTARSMAAQGRILAGFRRPRAGDRGLIAAPWTPLASLCLPFLRIVA